MIMRTTRRRPRALPRDDVGDDGRSPDAESVRRERGARRWTRTVVTASVILALGEALLGTTIDDPELSALAWIVGLVVGGLTVLTLMAFAHEGRASARAWEDARTVLLASAGPHDAGPVNDDSSAILELSWNTRGDIATVSWDGLESGRWAPTADERQGEDGRGWHLIHPTQMPSGHLARHHAFEPTVHHPPHLALDHQRYLLSEDNQLLVDSAGREWSLAALTWGRTPHMVGPVPRAMGPDGAVFTLRACLEMRRPRASRASSRT